MTNELDGSLRLLDVCGIIKDAVSQTKDCTHELQSIMRRRRGDDMNFMIEVRKDLSSRKDIKRAMNKALKVKESQDQNHETPAAVNMLKRARGCVVGLVPQARVGLLTRQLKDVGDTANSASSAVHMKHASIIQPCKS